MDNLTHSLFALTLAQTPLRRAGGGTTLALVIASNAPDIDIVTAFVGGSTSYLAAHRGLTHGLVGILALAGTATLAARILSRLRRGGRPASTRALAGAALLGAFCHVAMDLPTPYGTRFLTPFTSAWYAADWLPIIDLYLLIMLGAGLAAASLRPATRTRVAGIVLMLMAANYAARAALHHVALTRATVESPSLVASLHSWPDRPDAKLPVERPCAGHSGPESGCLIDAAALPTFLSPFRWRLLRAYPGGYLLSEIDLMRPSAPSPRLWYPSEDDPAILAAATAPPAHVLLRFSRFPAARILRGEANGAAVRIDELRFLGGAGPLAEDARPRGFFSVTVAIEPDGRVRNRSADQ